MNNFETKLKNEAQKIRLSKSERAVMRARIFNTRIESPYVAYSFQLTSVMRYALASLILVALVGSGTASAAQGALPGDLLYPVKISVNERVELALAITSEKKLETEVRFAERRLLEAQTLDEEERLDKETSEELEREFDRHVSNALAFADEVPEREDEDEGARGGAPAVSGGEEITEATTFALDAEAQPKEETTMEITMSLTVVATDTATTTREWRRDNLFETFEAKREAWKELRQHVERRERGEVHGASDERDEGDKDWEKQDNEDDGAGEGDGDWDKKGDGKDGKNGKDNDD